MSAFSHRLSIRCRWNRTRWLAILVCAAVGGWAVADDHLQAQQTTRRVNRAIEALAAGNPAFTGDTWAFVDREHRPYDITELRGTLTKLLDEKDGQGRPRLAPFVRIPTEGDQDVRWVIKQVLEGGAMGIIVPQVETAEQALKIAQAMRFPQLKTSPYQNPPGRRGCGCSGGQGWGLENPRDYTRVADPWPNNPEGELIALPMIETPLGVSNINAILETPGVTGVLIGPTDLTMNYGEGRWGSPEDQKPDSEAAIATVAQACVSKQKMCGMVTSNEEQTKQYLAAGFRIIFGTYLPGSMR